MKKVTAKNNSIWKKFLPVAIFSIITIAVYMPSSLFLGNIDSFSIDYHQIIPALAIGMIAVAFFEIVGLLVFRNNSRTQEFYINLLFGLTLGCYIQGNFLNGELMQLNGGEMDWAYTSARALVSTASWILCLTVPQIISKYRADIQISIRSIVSYILSAMQIISLVVLLATVSRTVTNDISVTKDGEFELAKENNIIVFIIDTLDAEFAEQYVLNDNQYKDIVKDFTYYDNVVGGGAPTVLGMPLLFTGISYDYPHQMTLDEYYQQAYGKSEAILFNDLSKNGYKVKLFTSQEYLNHADTSVVDNIIASQYEITSLKGFTKLLYKLTGYYGMPYVLKKQFVFYSGDFSQYIASEEQENYIFDDPQFYKDLTDSGVHVGNYKKEFILYHLYGSHGPYTMDENSNYVGDDNSSLEKQTQGSFHIVSEFLDDLKDAGLYDSSTIVIMADHGGINLYQNPAVFIKERDQHSGTVDSDPAMFTNIRASIASVFMDDYSAYGPSLADDRSYYNSTKRYITADAALREVSGFENDKSGERYYRYIVKGEARDMSQVEDAPEAPIENMYPDNDTNESQEGLMAPLYRFLGVIMDWCYAVCKNYGWAIVLFTFISKLILLPVSLWTYFNSIKMIKIQPEINNLKVRYYGQKDVIAEEQAKLFKQEKYRPMASIVPTVIQLVLLAGVVGVIRQGMNDPSIDMNVGSINLGLIPSQQGVALLWSPIIAGVSSLILCVAQNASNVLQAEQSKLNKNGTMILSVGLSLYLGWFVSIGTAFYWVCSNLMAVMQMYILNWIIRPRRFVDYDKLEKSRKALSEIQGIGKRKKDGFFSDIRRRESEDYKRFFSIVNKHLVFYSESNGFYKYFKPFIELLLNNTNIPIHYITSDPDDNVFSLAESNPQIRPYYIGENKLITMMMKMDADIVVMTMPDLENYHIKRSYIKKDIEYVFVQHGMGSNNMGMRKGCMDHFDTIFCAGPHQREEVEKTEAVYGMPKKKLIDVGYPLLDEMRAAFDSQVHNKNERPKILIAPSWQTDNIVDSCLETILNNLKDSEYEIIVRPHPQEVRMKQEYMGVIKEKYESDNIEIQTDFSSNNPILEADLLITDWSGISWEYAFTTRRPILFINTPMKVMNPDYQDIDTVPLNILLRDKLGKSIDPDNLENIADVVAELLANQAKYSQQIEDIAHKYIYNLDNSAIEGAKYILSSILDKVNNNDEETK